MNVQKCTYREIYIIKKSGICYQAIVLFVMVVDWGGVLPTAGNELWRGARESVGSKFCHTPRKTAAAGDCLCLRQEETGPPEGQKVE